MACPRTSCANLGPCCSALGVRYSIVWTRPNRLVPDTCDFAFRYWDFNCCRCFKLPVYVNAPPNWAGRVVLSGNLTWTVTQVPYGGPAYMRMQEDGTCAPATALLPIVIPPSACMVPVQDVAWDVTASGASGLVFTWQAEPSFFVGGYLCELLAPDGTVIRAEEVTPDAASVTFTDLQPETAYTFLITGICSRSGHGLPVAVPGVTLPPAALGPVINLLVYSIDEREDMKPAVAGGLADPSYATLVLSYLDFYCVLPADVSLTSAVIYPTGLAASFVQDNLTFTISSVPLSTLENPVVLLLTITGTVHSECLFPVPPAGAELLRTISLTVPSAPPVACPNTAGILPYLDAAACGSTCVAFSWHKTALFPYGVTYTVTEQGGGDPVAAGTVPYPNLGATIEGLTPGTKYTLTLTGRCGPDSSGAPVTIAYTTPAACEPSLPPFSGLTLFVSDPGSNPPTFTATVTYNSYKCVQTPTLSLPQTYTSPFYPGPVIIPSNGGFTWYVQNIPANTTVPLVFTANVPSTTGCPGCCMSDSVSASQLTTPQFTITSPQQSCTNGLLTLSAAPSLSGATCLSYTWLSASFAQGFQWQLMGGAALIQNGTLGPDVRSLTISGLQPETAYTFQIRGVCTGGLSTVYKSVSNTTAAAASPTLGGFVQDSSNTQFANNAANTFTTVSITYGPKLQTCVTGLVLAWNDAHTPPTGAVIVQAASGSNVWQVTGVQLSEASSTLYLQMDATGALATCSNGCTGAGTTVANSFEISVPAVTPTPTPPPAAAPFVLTITNYGGPPARLQKQSQSAPTLESNILKGAGAIDTKGSYLNQQSLNLTYATKIVQDFVKYHCQDNLITIDGNAPFYLPISVIHYGNTPDPTVQGKSVPTYSVKNQDYEATLQYNYANSSAEYGAINSDTDAYANFNYPPMLEFFKQMMVYNWEVEKGLYDKTNPTQIQLASNNYGSKNAGEQWWFNCKIDSLGNIITQDPTDPKELDSVVDGSADDGNVGGSTHAGWNCMERWLMHTAYCNQQLRKYIAGGLISAVVSGVPIVMTVNNLLNANAKYYQISAITTDAEGNSFDNTLYPLTAAITGPQCNATMKTLWDKWLNQTTAYAYGTQSWWSVAAQAGSLKAPNARADGTNFYLPCQMSMTTTGLLKGMSTLQLGSADYNAVSGVFNEIYDTSGDHPVYNCLGASAIPVSNCPTSSPAVSGLGFTAAMKADALATSGPYVQYPEQYLTQPGYGVWDLLIPPGGGIACTGALTAAPAGKTVYPSSDPGSLTAYNNSASAVSPVMNTSQFTAWSNAVTTANYPWILGLLTKTINPDTVGLGWALEGSRYDLYNGAWMAGVGGNNYANVIQGAALTGGGKVDGAQLWLDLSTGLKIRVVNRLKGLMYTPDPNTGNNSSILKAAKGMVWMLSNQSGPWVNCMGVRAGARVASGAPLQSDLLTFTCPDAAWPGWEGMNGQWWGPGTSANAGVLQQWSLDQMNLGSYDPSPTLLPTGSSEDNFGVFQDFNIQVAAWLAMAKDLQGLGANPNGISNSVPITYMPQTTDVPNLGCYELAYMPLSWFRNSA